MSGARRDRVIAAVLVVATALLAVLAAVRDPLPLPVVAHLGGPAVPIGVLQATAGVVVPLALVAVVAVLRAAGLLRASAVLWAQGAAAPILLVVIARLNGIAEAGSLVLVYACAGGGVLLRLAQTRTADPLPMRLEAVLGIVPWGVVAFAQVGGLLTGTPPSPAVRVTTVVVLLAAVAEWVIASRGRGSADRAAGLLLVALPAALAAALVLTTVR